MYSIQLNIEDVTYGLYGYLNIRYGFSRLGVTEGDFIKDLRTAVVSYVRTLMEESRDPLVPKNGECNRTDEVIFDELFIKHGFTNPKVLTTSTLESPILVHFEESILTAINVNRFSLWTLECHCGIYEMHNLGDFRILEWYRDHVEDGAYVG